MEINLKLEKEEALVLFDFLTKFNEKEHENLFANQAEIKVLQILECTLEKILEEPFLSNYRTILEKAYNTINDAK